MSIVWFRKCLRIHDNIPLIEALKKDQKVYPLFIYDENSINPEIVGVNRTNFLLESLNDLDNSLRKIGSRLLVQIGDYSTILKNLIKLWKIENIFYEIDTESESKEKEAEVSALCANLKVKFNGYWGHTLFNLDDIISNSPQNKIPLSYQSFIKVIDKLKEPVTQELDLEKVNTKKILEFINKEISPDEYLVPKLEHLKPYKGLKAFSPFKGGETAGLERLNDWMNQKTRVSKFEKPKTDPTDFGDRDTTVLSPYLKHGCVSVRLFYQKIKQVYKTQGNHTSKYKLHSKQMTNNFQVHQFHFLGSFFGENSFTLLVMLLQILIR
jgi:cryptochrome